MKTLQIGVVGSGTAGLAAAIALAQENHRVVVFEKHPAIAPVGAGILMQPQGVRALAALGCAEAFFDVSSPIAQLQLHNHREQRLVHIPYDAQDPAWGVSRGKLTAVLQRRLRELDGNLELGTHVTGIVDIRTEPSVMLETRMEDGSPRNWMFDAVVLACGSNSTLAERSGFGAPPAPYPWGSLNGLIRVDDWRYERELRQRVCGAKRMMGLLPSGRENGKLLLSFYWSLPTARYESWVDRDWSDFLAEVERFWPESSPVLAELRREHLSFARYRHSTPATYAHGRVALVGDAAHAMSPQLGLGSTLALEDALELAASLMFTHNVRAAFEDYSRARLPAARGKQRLSRALTPLFQSLLPAWVRDPLFLIGQHVPVIPGFMQASLGR
ncbi:TPA: FAD-dependent monooxygenase [Burkholderia vietnamiensis]|nr:FAD-dependent monooxygenase [Burkholderia vietnamiensis]